MFSYSRLYDFLISVAGVVDPDGAWGRHIRTPAANDGGGATFLQMAAAFQAERAAQGLPTRGHRWDTRDKQVLTGDKTGAFQEEQRVGLPDPGGEPDGRAGRGGRGEDAEGS